MLFVAAKTAEKFVEGPLRVPLLEALEGLGHAPLIRSARLHCFGRALANPERAKDLERALAASAEEEGDAPYVRGDIFCLENHAHFLIFGDVEDGGASLRAGLVYTAETADPAGKLDAFCQNVEDALYAASQAAGAHAMDAMLVSEIKWRKREGSAKQQVPQAVTAEESAALPAARGGDAADRVRAVELLEDVVARDFLRRLSEAQADNRLAEMLSAGGREPARDALVARLSDAGLVRREVQVSCRKSGRSIFRLPSSEALGIVTASNAVCSDCGAAVADERAEELATPTPLANSLLKGGAWLSSSVRAVLAGAGLREGEVTTRPTDAEAEAQLLANVSGEPFLLFVRDGDFTAADARRALEAEAETRATHLVVVSTGGIQDEARARLREHARRRTRAGGASEVVFVEGLEAAAVELRRAVERVSREALTRELFELDQGAGFNVGLMLAERFRLNNSKAGLRDLAASAAGAGGSQEL